MLHLNHRRLLGATSNLFLSKLKCSCEASALLTVSVRIPLWNSSWEIFSLSSLEAVEMCSALPGHASWSQTLVCITWVVTTRVRSHTEHRHTPCSVLFSLGGWKQNIEDRERTCSLGLALVCQSTKTASVASLESCRSVCVLCGDSMVLNLRTRLEKPCPTKETTPSLSALSLRGGYTHLCRSGSSSQRVVSNDSTITLHYYSQR